MNKVQNWPHYQATDSFQQVISPFKDTGFSLSGHQDKSNDSWGLGKKVSEFVDWGTTTNLFLQTIFFK